MGHRCFSRRCFRNQLLVSCPCGWRIPNSSRNPPRSEVCPTPDAARSGRSSVKESDDHERPICRCVRPGRQPVWRQNRHVWRFLADHGSDAGKRCAWKEMARLLEDTPATLGLEGRCREIPLSGSDRPLSDLLRDANQSVAVRGPGFPSRPVSHRIPRSPRVQSDVAQSRAPSPRPSPAVPGSHRWPA